MRMNFTMLGSLFMAGVLVACGGTSGNPPASTGGTNQTGGTQTTGGSANTGGSTPTGGTTQTGGTILTGGATATGGSTQTGGVTQTGGNATSGGAVNTGGVAITGGAAKTGGTTSTGGTTNTGGTIPTGGTTNTGGTTTTGGTTANGGAAATGGTTSTGTPVTCTPGYTGSSRPQLTDAAAACYTLRNYLAQAGTIGALVRDDWDPSTTPLAIPTTADFTVAADGSGTHTTVQAAVTAAMTSASTVRKTILVKPGTYRELVCVKGGVPITLYGADSDASKVVIAYDNYNAKTVDTTKVNACSVPSGTTYGTSGSTTFFAHAAGFQALNLTLANDYAEANNGTFQAVALTAQGDKQVYQNVRLLGNQDTLQVKTGATTTVARSYFKSCYIEGDVDFIFGRGTAVFDACTMKYITSRGKKGSTIFAPSTENAHPFGMLVVGSTLGSDSGAASGSTYLGRDWVDSAGTAANGQIVIRESTLDATIRATAPWADSTTSEAFNAASDRLFEYKNTGAGAAK